jgi:DNA mismatch endonuclease (patch repair protein)
MVDVFTPEKRSDVMSRIKGRNTIPELRVRSLLHSLGFRFRLHLPNLPGRPDIALPKYKTVVMVHGCFWHQHQGCKDGRPPRSNNSFWVPKLERNRARDASVTSSLKKLGFKVVVVWECELSRERTLKRKLERIRK